MILLGTIASSLLQNIDKGVMDPLQVITVGPSGASSVTFTNISQDYAHLQIRVISRTSALNQFADVKLRFNGDTGTNYTLHQLLGTGSSVISAGYANETSLSQLPLTHGSDGATNVFPVGILDVLDYSNTNKFKTVRCLGGVDTNGDGRVYLNSGLWRGANAVTSMSFYLSSGNFVQNSQFALYGIKAAA